MGRLCRIQVTESQAANFLSFIGHMQVTCNLGVVGDFGLSGCRRLRWCDRAM